MLRVVSAIVALSACLSVAPLSSRQADGVIIGVILDSATMTPVWPSQVAIVGTPRFALGDTLGRFILDDVAAGEYKLLARGMLHLPESLSVQVAGDTVRLTPIRLRLDARADSIARSIRIIAPGDRR